MDKDLRKLERQILAGETDRLPEYLHWQGRLGKVSKLWVVVSETFDYNDEYYYQTEGGGGEPVNAFLSEASAEAEASRLNTDWLRNNAGELGAWSYEGMNGMFDMDEAELEQFLSSRGAILEEDGIDVGQCTDAQCQEIVSALTVRVFTTREIPLVDGLCSPDEVLNFCHTQKASSVDQPADADGQSDETAP